MLRRGKWQDIEKLSDLQDKLGKSHEEMANLVLSDLHEEPYSLNEVCPAVIRPRVLPSRANVDGTVEPPLGRKKNNPGKTIDEAMQPRKLL